MEDDEFASMCMCAILSKFEAITTCAADFQSAVDRWDEQQDDQRLDVVPARPSPGLVPLSLARPNPALTLALTRYYLTGSWAACLGWTCSNTFSEEKRQPYQLNRTRFCARPSFTVRLVALAVVP